MSTRPRPVRTGFTVVELLVTTSIGFLMAVQATPMILKSRDMARMGQCSHNLKTIGLALHNYMDTFNGFPPGFVLRNWDSTTQQGFGWQTMILPYMDQATVYNKIKPDGGGLNEAALDDGRREAMMGRILVFRCPADVTPDLNEFRGGWPTSNYSGNAGYHPFPRLVGSAVGDFWPGSIPTPHGVRSRDAKTLTGIFSVNSIISTRDVTDGTSNTLLVGERALTSDSGIWVGVTSAIHENDQLTETSHLSRPNLSRSAYSSTHTHSFQAVMCDGSVRRIDESIESLPNLDPQKPLGVIQRLGGRNDGQIVEF